MGKLRCGDDYGEDCGEDCLRAYLDAEAEHAVLRAGYLKPIISQQKIISFQYNVTIFSTKPIETHRWYEVVVSVPGVVPALGV